MKQAHERNVQVSRRKPYLVATFVTHKHNKRPVVLLHVIVDEDRDTGV
jgi:hypothetical protein